MHSVSIVNDKLRQISLNSNWNWKYRGNIPWLEKREIWCNSLVACDCLNKTHFDYIISVVFSVDKGLSQMEYENED